MITIVTLALFYVVVTGLNMSKAKSFNKLLRKGGIGIGALAANIVNRF